ncbi:hypothetical protein SLA2020_420660 [Shorea laevis]
MLYAAPPVLPPSLTLVGKIISLKPISKATIKKNILHAWSFLKSVSIEAKDDNKAVFIFEDLEELSRVLDQSPWNIKGAPLFLKPWKNDDTYEDVDFSTGAFWIQFMGFLLIT